MPRLSSLTRLTIFALLFASILHNSTQSKAQRTQAISPIAARIVDTVDESRLTRLSGNVTLLASPAYDQGEASSSTQLTHIRLVLSRTREQQAALDKFEAELQDSSSANFHKWLTPEQFGKLYGPADADIEALVNWLESRGLTVETVSPGRTNIAFAGTVSQIEAAFHTQIHSFDGHGQRFLSNIDEPSIPAALATVVKGIAHLNTFLPTVNSKPGPTGRFDPETNHLVPVSIAKDDRLRPDLTTGNSPSYTLYVTAADAATIYNTPNNFNANYGSAVFEDGTGVTIGIGGESLISSSTVSSYRSKFIGSSNPIQITYVDAVTTNGATDEAYIDTELAGALAPGANIHYYASTDLFSAVIQAIDENTVDIFSLSFSACEKYLTTSDNATVSGWWEQAAAQGIAITVSTGDDGSAGCDATSTKTGNVTAAVNGLLVSGLASTPYNIAVGGTDFYGLKGSFSNYVNTDTTNPGYYYRSALGYIPESTWNDSTLTNTSINTNAPRTGKSANIAAGSGGKSSCSTNSTTSATVGTCTSGYPKPSWQSGPRSLPDGARDLPDISLMSGDGSDSAAWLVCTDGTFTSGGKTYTTNCIDTGNGFAFSAYGGTSTATPAFAGILAMIQQKTKDRLGQAAVELYALYNDTHAGLIFHDVTVGSNAVPCTSGTPSCVKSTAGNYYESAYNAASGYDLATGMGSLNVTELANNWVAQVGTATSTVDVTPSATTIKRVESLSVAVTVSGSGSLGTPTGTVTLTSSGFVSNTIELVSGSATISLPPVSLSAGRNTLKVTYSGDFQYATASGTTVVTVTEPTIKFSASQINFPNTAKYGTSPQQTITVTSSGTDDLNIGSIDLVGINPDSFSQTNNCITTLAPNATCTINVAFAPTTSGNLQAQLRIIDNVINNPEYIGLSGLALPPPFPEISLPSFVYLGNQPVGSSRSGELLNIGNTGGVALSISSISIGGVDASSFSESGNCSSIAAQSNCPISLTFTPAKIGSLSATLTITDNAKGSPHTVTLNGTGAPPILTVAVAPGALTFPPTAVGSSLSQNITITNTGTGASTITAIAIAGASTTSYSQSSTCPTSLAVNATCSITVTFAPNTLGPLPATLTITDNATNSPQSVPLSGSGIAPGSFTISASNVTVNKGVSGNSTITVTPTGGYFGNMTFTCAVTPISGGKHTPTCVGSNGEVQLNAPGGGPIITTGGIAVLTTGPTSSAVHARLEQAPKPGARLPIFGAAGIVIGCVALLGIPARRRSWKAILGVLVLTLGLGTFSACGGSGGGGGTTPPPTIDPGTTSGNYTITVTATDTVSSIVQTTTFTLTVN